MAKHVSAVWSAALIASLAAAGCGGGMVEDDSAGAAGQEVKGAARCSVTPASPLVGEDYSLDIAGMRRLAQLRVTVSDASGSQEQLLASDKDGRASLLLRSSTAGHASAIVEAERRGIFAEATRCSFEIVSPPVCGDGTCQASESCASCAGDCGACPACGDGSCNGSETCLSCAQDCGACAPACGDGSCNGTETCSSCAQDCGACPPVCGDGACNGTETCSSCSKDCGACAPACGDGACNGLETCTSCSQDCGACPPACGDGTCNGTETCSSCALDCGACPPVCGDGTCNGTETCSSCSKDCGACPPSTTCEPEVTSVTSGRHNAGKSCTACHDGGTAIQWTVAGTLYNDAAGSAPVPGATILVKDAAGKTIKLVTAANGNFYTSDTSIRFPIQVGASKCPNTTPMQGSVSDGSCNSCHGSGFRIHLP